MSKSWAGYLVPSEHRRINEFVGLLLLTTAILVALSLVSFNPDDPSFNISKNPRFAGKAKNFVGVAGAVIADGMFQVLGYSSFLIPIFLGVYAFYWLASWTVQSFVVRFTGMSLMMLTIASSLAMFPALPRIRGQIPAGGLLGKLLAESLDAAVNPTGSVVILLSTFLISLFLATTFSFEWAIAVLKPRFASVSSLADRWSEWKQERAQARELRREEERKPPKKQFIVTPRDERPVSRARNRRRQNLLRSRRQSARQKPRLLLRVPIPIRRQNPRISRLPRC